MPKQVQWLSDEEWARIEPVLPRGRKGAGGSGVRGFGLFSVVPTITGILSGRIRTDSLDNFASDMMGLPSEEDRRKAFEDQQRALNPKWKPGDPIVI